MIRLLTDDCYGDFSSGDLGWGVIEGNNARVRWYTCRDNFQQPDKIERRKSFTKHTVFFRRKRQELQATQRFIRKIEEILKLKKHIKFLETDNANVVCLKLPVWWRQTLRFSLLTLLLRIGVKYKHGWRKLLKDTRKYRTDNHYALKWFLKGHTEPSGNTRSGWCDTFRRKKRSVVREILRQNEQETVS